MWLLPAWTTLSRFSARTYYRLQRAGGEIPPTGPVLLLANHPNSLLDPALVVAAVGRPVRFLAGSHTVAHPQVGWLVRGAGSIPVYRRLDDPAQVGRNVEMFRAATAALAEGAAIGIFPEGVSVDDPFLQPLRTGAARLALSAFPQCDAFPLIPVGLVYRDRDRFRSEALVVVGRPIEWADLAATDASNADAVRELTRRIESALRDVTLNLERWEDAPLVECAEAIWSAELGTPTDAAGGAAGGAAADAAARVERLRLATETLALARRDPSARWTSLVHAVARHARVLALLGVSPADLHDTPTAAAAVRWMARRLPTLALGALLLTVGWALFWVPYNGSAILGTRTSPKDAATSTHTALFGTVVFLLWIILLAAGAGWLGGWPAALIALAVLPLWALASAGARDRWRDAWRDVRRFLALRRHRARLRELAETQRALGHELAHVIASVTPRGTMTQLTPSESVARDG